MVGPAIPWLCGGDPLLIIPLTRSANFRLIAAGRLLNILLIISGGVFVGGGLVAMGSRVVGGVLVAMVVDISFGTLFSLSKDPVIKSLIRCKTEGINFSSSESKFLLPLRSLLSISARVTSVLV